MSGSVGLDAGGVRRTRDEGSALIMVLGAMSVLTIFVTVALNYAMQTSSTAQHATAWNQALSAAETGVDNYLARLNQDDGYWRTVDCDNLAQQRPLEGDPAPCGWGASAEIGWLAVPGAERAEFHYEADTTTTVVDGTVDLTSTGRVGDVTRTIRVSLRPGGFGEFLYYTVYETTDPANEAVFGYNNTTAMAECSKYYWEGRNNPVGHVTCGDLNFVTNDVINGPMHTNDTMLVSGSPRFQGAVTTSTPLCKPVEGVIPPATKCYRKVSSSSVPRFSKGIGYRDEIELPESVGDLLQHVDPLQTATPGCLYTGPTRIAFDATAGVPTMKVWSKWSRTLNPGCGNPSDPWPQILAVPANNLILVRDVPQSQPDPVTGSCATGSIGDGFPQAGDYNQTLRESDCRTGTIYVEGTLKGRVTISATNNIIVTGDLTYSGGETGSDALGLIAENSVKIYHPVTRTCDKYDNKDRCTSWSNYRNMLDPDGHKLQDPKVQAAILTLRHSFTVQAYNYGAKFGSIHLFGSMAQRFRGPVGTGSSSTLVSGYLKDYNYDSRLRYAPPPYFLDPVRAAWGVKTFGEVTPLYGG